MTTLQTATRIALKNILFATDFSETATQAMRYAGTLAKTFGANLFAIHVQEAANYALPPEMWQSAEAAAQEELAALRRTLMREFPGVRSQVLRGEGNVWTAIEDTIRLHEVDLIVLGTHGRTGLGRLILGSQAEEILRQARCPVLTVGPNVETDEAPGEKFTSVLFATDFGPASEAALAHALSIAEENQARLTLLHVIEHPKAGEIVRPAELLEGTEEHLAAMVPEEAKLWCTPKCVVEEGGAAEKILQTAGHVGADLIVIGVHKAGTFGAATHLAGPTVHNVLVGARCPVLTLRG
jgi:nucleotide-binding universal stress UspA family protein